MYPYFLQIWKSKRNSEYIVEIFYQWKEFIGMFRVNLIHLSLNNMTYLGLLIYVSLINISSPSLSNLFTNYYEIEFRTERIEESK